MQEIKEKKSAKMFSVAVDTLLPSKGLALGLTAAEWPPRLKRIAQGIKASYLEVKPT